MAEVMIRAPSVEALFDDWSDESLERRPLNDEARGRIVDAWTQSRKTATGTPTVVLRLPEADRRQGLDVSIAAAVRHDMESMAAHARKRWIRRSLRPRESRIGIVLFVLALTIAGIIDQVIGGDSFLSQGFVVLAWVAIWGPAYRFITAASFRMGHKYFIELSHAEVRVVWDPG